MAALFVRAGGLSLIALAACMTGVAVTVVTKPGDSYRHPVQVSEEEVRSALDKTGRLLWGDIQRISPDIARKFAGLRSDEHVHIERTSTSIEMFVTDEGLTLNIQSNGSPGTQITTPAPRVPTVAVVTREEETPRQEASPSRSAAAPRRHATDALDPTFVTAAPQPAAYALIIGIEHYRDVPAATGARADAERFAAVATKTLGLRDDHIRVALEDHATRADMLSGLKWLQDNLSAGGRAYFFFSGHGAPSADSSTYLLSYDGSPKDVAGSALAMSDVMKALSETKAKDVLAIVDACFSGAGGRSVLPPGARPLMRVKELEPGPQMALFTASQGDEISGSASDENAGVFTKWVTQGLGTGQADMNGDGQVSLQELADWVGPRVARDAKKESREQHPKLLVGSGLTGPANFIVEYGLATR
jgi:hypothetical protein